jgi:hypothetical protein
LTDGNLHSRSLLVAALAEIQLTRRLSGGIPGCCDAAGASQIGDPKSTEPILPKNSVVKTQVPRFFMSALGRTFDRMPVFYLLFVSPK